MPEHQIAEGIDQAGEKCQGQQQRRQRAMLAVAFGNERPARVGEEGVHFVVSPFLIGSRRLIL
jgi:hypothetical protein